MHGVYKRDRQKAIRGKYFIELLHKYCCNYLISNYNIPSEFIKTEYKLYGAYKTKVIDVGVIHPQAGPLIVITVRSQMSSIAKNIDTNFESLIGDATNLHDKYPTLVLAHLLLWPTIGLTKEREKPPFKKIIPLLEQITNRKNITDPTGKYEHIAFLVVDFESAPPKIEDNIPPKNSALRIEKFFDKIYNTFRERNKFIEF